MVVDGETGLLVHYDADEPGQFEADFATAINKVIEDPSRARQMGHAGRERAISDFGWDRIAARTVEVYEQAQAVHGELSFPLARPATRRCVNVAVHARL